MHCLGIFESLDECELLLFHHLYVALVLQPRLLFASQFIAHLLSSTQLLVVKVVRLLLLGLLLLLLDERLDHGGLRSVLMILMIE